MKNSNDTSWEFAFGIVQKLPRFFGSTLLAQLVILLCAVLLCLTIYCSENLSTFLMSVCIQQCICIVIFIIAREACSFSCTSPDTFQFADAQSQPCCPISTVQGSLVHCRFIFQCETEDVLFVILSVFVYRCTRGMIIYKL